MRDRPWARAIVRAVQWVAASGVVCNVASTTCWTTPGAIAFLRPGRRASFISPGTPERVKRPRQSSTVGRLMPSWPAIA